MFQACSTSPRRDDANDEFVVCWPRLKRRRSGSIIATASIAGLRSEPLVGYAYTATKAAVANIVRHAAVELAPFNIRVNAIAPGPFITNIRDGVMHRDPKVVEQFAAMVPLGRVAKTDEIKGLALLLVPAGSFIPAVIPSTRHNREIAEKPGAEVVAGARIVATDVYFFKNSSCRSIKLLRRPSLRAWLRVCLLRVLELRDGHAEPVVSAQTFLSFLSISGGSSPIVS